MKGPSKEIPDTVWHKNAVRKKHVKQPAFQLGYIYYLHEPKYL